MKETPAELPRIASYFGQLCDRAAEHGLLVHLEFLPWTQIKDLPTALEIVQMAERPNGGIMLDSWHHFRSQIGNEVLDAVPGERIAGIQLNDAPARPGPDVVMETLRHRLLPGEGDIDLVDLMQRLRKIGCSAPIGVEIFSERLAQLPAEEIARQAAASTRAVLERAF
jgi:sugar phosphate isomerase/epimerase